MALAASPPWGWGVSGGFGAPARSLGRGLWGGSFVLGGKSEDAAGCSRPPATERRGTGCGVGASALCWGHCWISARWGTGNKDTGGSGILPAGFSSAHGCAEPCNVPQNCAAPRAPLPARGDPGLGGAGGRSEERHTKGTQVQREPCHHAIKRRRKTIPVIAKLVRSTGAILWLFKPTCGPITAWLEPSEGKAAKCILLPVVSFTIF